MNKLNSKNWQRVRISNKAKTITFTNDTTYKTKAECENDIKSAQYIAINLKALNKLVSDGYSVNDTTIETVKENATESVKQAENVQDVELLNPEIEAQIEAYAQAKIERDIKAYEEKKRKQEAIARFLNTPPTQPKQQAFDYDKQWDKYYKTGKPRAERALNAQMSQYKEV